MGPRSSLAVGQHAHADVDAADEAGGDQRDQGPGQPVAALGDQPVERLLDLWLPGPVTVPGCALVIGCHDQAPYPAGTTSSQVRMFKIKIKSPPNGAASPPRPPAPPR